MNGWVTKRRAARVVFDAVDPFSQAKLTAYAELLRYLCRDTLSFLPHDDDEYPHETAESWRLDLRS